jgi:hypothetical protein
MGLTRVLIGVIPLMGLIMLEGFNLLTTNFSKPVFGKIIAILLLGYIVIFPFTKTKGAVVFDRDMHFSNEQQAARETANYIRSKYPVLPGTAFEGPPMAFALDVDPFIKPGHINLNPENIKTLKPGDLLIWENHFALLDKKLEHATLDNDPQFETLFTLRKTDESNTTAEFIVYRKK